MFNIIWSLLGCRHSSVFKVHNTFWCSQTIWGLIMVKLSLSSIVFDKSFHNKGSDLWGGLSVLQSNKQLEYSTPGPLDTRKLSACSLRWRSASLLSICQHVKLSLWGRFGATWLRGGNFLYFLTKCVSQPVHRHPQHSGPWLTFSVSAGRIPASL